jgi:hypothetical protein
MLKYAKTLVSVFGWYIHNADPTANGNNTAYPALTAIKPTATEGMSQPCRMLKYAKTLVSVFGWYIHTRTTLVPKTN